MKIKSSIAKTVSVVPASRVSGSLKKDIEFFEKISEDEKRDEQIREGVKKVAEAKRKVLGGRLRQDNSAKILMPRNRQKKREPSFRMVKAFKYLAENGGPVGKAMLKAGYAPVSAKTPAKMTRTKGFRMLCESMGLDKSLIVGSLVEDIRSKPGFRLGELKLASSFLGLVSHQGTKVNVNLNQIQLKDQDKTKIIDIL